MASLNSIGGLHYEMMKRCYNENSVAYKSYGAKGITVCDEWHNRDNFRKWANDNGYVKGLRLERIDTKKGYYPENCRFGTTMKRNENSVSHYTREIRKHREKMIAYSGIPGKYCESRIYKIYCGMHTRCENKNYSNYNNYGGRGICVCDEWSGKDGFFYFYKWSMENGYSDDLSIDRIDCNGNYEPFNCRWVSMDIQIKNRRNSLNYIYNGLEMNLADIARLNNFSYGEIRYRIVNKKMTLEEALNDLKKNREKFHTPPT